MRKFKIMILVLVLMTVSIPTFAEEDITIITTNLYTQEMNMQYHTSAIEFIKGVPFINEDGHLLVPAARYCRGAAVNYRWYSTTNKIRLQVFGRELWFTIDSKDYTYRGGPQVVETLTDEMLIDVPLTDETLTNETLIDVPLTMEAAPVLKDGIVYIPVKFVAESFGGEYSWDEARKIATVKYNTLKIKEEGGTKQVGLFSVPVKTRFCAYELDYADYQVVSMSADILNSDYAEQLVILRATLLQVFDDSLVDDVMDYVALMEDRYVKLESKGFYDKEKDGIIVVEAGYGEVRIRLLLRDLPRVK